MSRQQMQCPYCRVRADQLVGPLAVPKYPGWVRYECANGHRFAIVEKKR